jgi:hypothetical protein
MFRSPWKYCHNGGSLRRSGSGVAVGTTTLTSISHQGHLDTHEFSWLPMSRTRREMACTQRKSTAAAEPRVSPFGHEFQRPCPFKGGGRVTFGCRLASLVRRGHG